MTSTVSDTIRLARVLCILLLVYAHAQPYQPGTPEDWLSPMGLIHYLRQLLGHTSVPLLSLVSGYLLARLLDTRAYTEELGRKGFSLIVPLLLWNLVYLAKEGLESGAAALPAPTGRVQMFCAPPRSETKYSARPSAAHIGHSSLAPPLVTGS